MRSTLTVLALLAAAPLGAQVSAPMTPRMSATSSSDRSDVFAPLRPGELHSAAFLTEMQPMPYGRVLGPVSQAAVVAHQSAEMVMVGRTIGLLPPAGAAYQRGDTVVLAAVTPAARGWGEMVVPTGLALVGASTPRQTEALVIASYGPIRAGQVTLPMGPTPTANNSDPVKADGPTGNFLFGEEQGNPRQLGSQLFIDIGSNAGLRLGDYIEFRGHPGPRLNGADTIDKGLAIGQVVHLGAKSSTVRLYRISDPTIVMGTPAVRVATLPN